MSSKIYIEQALNELDNEVIKLLEAMASQTQKNEKMARLVYEKKILQQALEALIALENNPVSFKACGSQPY